MQGMVLLVLLMQLLSYTDGVWPAETSPAGWVTYVQRHSNTVVGGDDYFLGELKFIGQEVSYNYKTLPTIAEAKDTIDAQGNRTIFYGRSTSGGRSTGNMVYLNYADSTVECVQYIEREYFLYEDTLPNINWVISEERKTVGGFITQKAIGGHRGRVYEVWFAPEIPIAYGPWKLGGLPGLILEAETQDGELSFTVDVIQIPTDGILEIQPPQRGIRFKDFRTFWIETNRYEQQALERRRVSYERTMRETLPEGTPVTLGRITNSRFSIEKLDD